MSLGAALFGLTRHRAVIVVSLAAAAIAAGSVIYTPSLLPPGLHRHGVQIAAASTELLVASPEHPPANAYAYEAGVNRALLVGNIVISPAVVDGVAAKLGLSPDAIRGAPPVTANVPAALIQPGGGGGPLDILAWPDHYKVEVQADPTVPILHLYTQAPTAARAVELANALAQGVTGYLQQSQQRDGIPVDQRVDLEQLGTAQGGDVKTGAELQMVLLVFGSVFVLLLWLAAAAARVRRSWAAAQGGEVHEGRATLRKIATYSSE
jgi:hypothetical protein